MTTAARSVAVIGAGPAGAYAVQHLLAQTAIDVEVDLFDRSLTPWGLIRHGVAADHQHKKQIADRAFEPLLRDERTRFHGGVEVGNGLSFELLASAYDAVIVATGADGDNSLGIPGEDLPGSWTSRQFVGWCNGEPAHAKHRIDLSSRRAVIIGNGNVALDIARLLLRPVGDLGGTDLADYALTELLTSTIDEVVIAARRGPADAAFHAPELEEFGELSDLEVSIAPDARLVDRALADAELPPIVRRKLSILRQLAARPGRVKRLVFLFGATPVSVGGESCVERACFQGSNALAPSFPVECGLFIRATGFKGTPRSGLPHDTTLGIVPTEGGRVAGLPYVYATGWARRGCRGVIGSNRKCAQSVVDAVVSDLLGKGHDDAQAGRRSELLARLAGDHAVVDKQGWRAIDREERLSGRAAGRPRIKLTQESRLREAASQAGNTGR